MNNKEAEIQTIKNLGAPYNPLQAPGNANAGTLKELERIDTAKAVDDFGVWLAKNKMGGTFTYQGKNYLVIPK